MSKTNPLQFFSLQPSFQTRIYYGRRM